MEQTTETQETPTASVTPEVPNEEKAFPALGREHDITAFASSDPSRYVIGGVFLDTKRKAVVATDGGMLIQVPFDVTEEFPPLGEGLSPVTQPVILPAKQLKEAITQATKYAGSLPILSRVAVAKNGETNKVALATTDLDTQRDYKVKVIEGNYPNYMQVIPTEQPPHSICLSAQRLKTICEYALKNAAKGEIGIRFAMSDELSPITFSIVLPEGKRATGVLMPMRMS